MLRTSLCLGAFPSRAGFFLIVFSFGLGRRTGTCSFAVNFGFNERRAAGRNG